MDAVSNDRPGASNDELPGRRFDDVPRLQAEDRHVLRGAGDEPAAGSGGDEGSALASAALCQFPSLKEKTPRERIEALGDHISDTAIHRGAVEELRLNAHIDLREAKRELGSIPTGVSSDPRRIETARRSSRPDLAARIDDAQWVIDRCREQINRLERDFDAASRVYTLISGS